MSIELEPIGFVRTDAKEIPRHWRASDVEGTLVIDEKYQEGLKDIEPDQRIVVIFNFHRSPKFSSRFLRQMPPHSGKEMGVFSICSPIRPNPIGMSILEVLEVKGATIHVRRLDMLEGTPILDIKPYIEDQRGQGEGGPDDRRGEARRDSTRPGVPTEGPRHGGSATGGESRGGETS